MHEPALPNFFIVGTGKAGTTSLYHYLQQHPQIYMSPIKEPCYFASEIRPENLTASHLRHIRRMSRELPGRLSDGKPVRPLGWLVSQWEDYLRLFARVNTETAIGEASVGYLWSRTAAANIASRMPNAKIIMILRDPSERAFSQYLHQLSVGLTYSTFREHIKNCMRNSERKLGAHYPFLEVGLYTAQVKRYLDLFPGNNIRIYWYEEAWKDPPSLLEDLFDFLSVDSTFRSDTSKKKLQRRAPRFTVLNYLVKQFGISHRLREMTPVRLRPQIRTLLFRDGFRLKMRPLDRRYLVDYYRDDVVNLASLLNRDLSGWLT
jgi:hypothetical protein